MSFFNRNGLTKSFTMVKSGERRASCRTNLLPLILSCLLLAFTSLLGCTEANPDFFKINPNPVVYSDYSDNDECPIKDILNYCEPTYEIRALLGDCETPDRLDYCRWFVDGNLVRYPETNKVVYEKFKRNQVQCISGTKAREFRYGLLREGPPDSEPSATYTVLDEKKPIATCSKYLQADYLD